MPPPADSALNTPCAQVTRKSPEERQAEADAVMAELLAEEEVAKAEAHSKKSKKKKKKGRAIPEDSESSDALLAPAEPVCPSPASPAVLAAELAVAALRAAIASGELPALEKALAAAPSEVWAGSVVTQARALRDRMLEEQQEAERKAKQEAAAQAAAQYKREEAEAKQAAVAEQAREKAEAAVAAMAEAAHPVAVALDLAQLRALTDDFDERAEVGRGGFGKVYQAKDPHGRPIAIKRGANVDRTFQLKDLKREVRGFAMPLTPHVRIPPHSLR